jgi:hypothetical protein
MSDHPERTTLSGKPADPACVNTGAPQPIDTATGMHRDYWVLSEEERAKGFVRPLYRSYQHVGKRPKYPLRDLTEEEQMRYASCGYVRFEAYPESESPKVGCFWTREALDSGCGANTTMGLALCETYARSPSFYGSTFCANCRKHFPVDEFVWIDEKGCATDKTVGS